MCGLIIRGRLRRFISEAGVACGTDVGLGISTSTTRCPGSKRRSKSSGSSVDSRHCEELVKQRAAIATFGTEARRAASDTHMSWKVDLLWSCGP